MSDKTVPARTAAEAWLAMLKARGVDYLFANAGTDFPSIIEAFARSEAGEIDLPRPMVVPHENAAVGMAHGYYLVTGRAQAAMVHVNVGTANALAGLMNASREQVPLMLAAGRNPILEKGAPGARSMHIHWAQEMFDQGAIVREMVRWDYELRDPRQLETVVDRALALANTHPRGPVYLSLPREVMAEPVDGVTPGAASRMTPAAPPAPNPQAIAAAADILAKARNPVIVTSRLGSQKEAVAPFADLVERFALPVVDFRPRYLNLPHPHPMHGGFDVAPWMGDADAILVFDADVPWFPGSCAPSEDCPVIQIGPDPVFSRYPIRGFASDVTIQSDFLSAVTALDAALAERLPEGDTAVAERRGRVAARVRGLAGEAEARVVAGHPMSKALVSRCLSELLPDEAILVNEYTFDPSVARRTRPGTYFGSPSVSGLGWGLPAALGAQLADRERLTVATLGDGAYLFANPLVCHQVAAAYELPVLTLIFNNAEWGAVREATVEMYPDGHAVKSNRMPLVHIGGTPKYEDAVKACGGHGERVETAEDLPAALERALKVVREERRQALLNIICA